MPDAEYSLSLTESSTPAACSASCQKFICGAGRSRRARCAPPSLQTQDGNLMLERDALSSAGWLGASPKLGSEQTPIELLTPHADEAVFAKKRTGRN
jgi:hypothetical protein